MNAAPSPSPALLEANRRLYELRAQAQAGRPTAPAKPGLGTAEHEPRHLIPAESRLAEAVAALPDHLGWDSQAATRAIRVALARRGQEKGQGDEKTGHEDPGESGETREPRCDQGDKGTGGERGNCQRPPACAGVKHYPSLGLAALKADDVPAFRVWLAGRYLDRDGRGWLAMAQVRSQLVDELRLCGWRRLRQVLGQGDGRYWTWDKERGRLWLFGAARVAAGLGVERLSGRPVGLPLSALTEGIGDFRAHLYASFHSGRAKETIGGRAAMPIARQTMTAVSGVGRRSQRAYEQRLRLPVQPNYAIGERADSEQRYERAWQKGQALFELKDYRGRQGKKGQRYLAWQLPNSYSACHTQRPKGRQRRINRELKDLVLKGTPGNAEGTGETPKPDLARRYYPTGKLAAEACSRRPDYELYWQRQQSQNQHFEVWQVLFSG